MAVAPEFRKGISGAISFLARNNMHCKQGAEDRKEVFGECDWPVGTAHRLDDMPANHKAGKSTQSSADEAKKDALKPGAIHRRGRN